MDNDRIEELLVNYYRAWSCQDRDGVMSFFSEDSTFEDLAFAVKFEGLEQIRSFVDLTYVGSPDFQVNPTQIVIHGDTAAAEWTMSGTHSGDYPGLPATGQRFLVRAASFVSFSSERIETIRDYWNPLEFKLSVGLA